MVVRLARATALLGEEMGALPQESSGVSRTRGEPYPAWTQLQGLMVLFSRLTCQRSSAYSESQSG